MERNVDNATDQKAKEVKKNPPPSSSDHVQTRSGKRMLFFLFLFLVSCMLRERWFQRGWALVAILFDSSRGKPLLSLLLVLGVA